MTASDRNRPERMAGPPATQEVLEAAGLRYLTRYAASAERVRRVLWRRVARSVLDHGTSQEDGRKIVDELITRWVASGLIDDRAFAEMQTRRLARRGAPRRQIAAKLAQAGVDSTLSRETLTQADDLTAAAIFARRRGLGPFRAPESRATQREKDLNKLGRAGFDRRTAERIIDAIDPEELEMSSRSG